MRLLAEYAAFDSYAAVDTKALALWVAMFFAGAAIGCFEQ